MFRKRILTVLTVCCLTLTVSAQNIDSLEKAVDNKNLTVFQLVDAQNNLGRRLVFVDPVRAAQLATESLLNSIKINYPIGQAYACLNLSAIYSSNDLSFISNEYIQRAFLIFQTHNDSAGIANCYLTMGHTSRKLQKMEEEVEYNRKAFEIFSRLQIPDRMAIAAHHLGESYFISGDYPKSREYIGYAIKLNDSLQNYQVLSHCYLIMGKLELLSRNFNLAENYFKQVLDISDKLGPDLQKKATVESMLELAAIYGQKHNKRLQLSFLNEAAGLSEKLLLVNYLQTIYTDLIQFYAKEKNEQQVLKFTNEFNQVSKSVNEKLIKKQALLGQYAIRVYQFLENEKQKLETENIIKADRIKIQNLFLFIMLFFGIILMGLIVVLLKSLFNQKKIKRQIKDNEEKYSSLVEQSLTGIYIIRDEKFTYVNPRLAEIFGYTPGEMINLENAGNIIYEPDRELVRKTVLDRLEGKSAKSNYRIRGIKKDGSIIHIEVFGTIATQAGRKVTIGTLLDVTENVNASVEIESSKKKFQSLIENISGVYWVNDLETYQTLYISPSYEKVWGRKCDDLYKNPADFINAIHPDDKEFVLKAYSGIVKTKSASISYRIIRPDGEIRWVSAKTSVVTDSQGLKTEYGYAEDITERILSEKEIKKYNERFELIASSTQDAIWEWNLETNELWGNEVHQRMYGLTLADPVPTEEMWKQRIHPDERDALVKLQKTTLASDKNVWISEYRFQKPGGGYINVYDRTYIVRDKNGKAIRIMGSMMDITERKKAEDAVRESEEKFRTLVQQAAEGIFILDMEGNYLDANESAEILTGYSGSELKKMHVSEIIYKEDLKKNPLKLEEIKSGNPLFAERIIKTKDNKLINVEVSAKLMSNGKVISILRDITERKKAQDALIESEEKYRSLIEQASEPILIYSFEGKILEYNKAAIELSGYTPEEFSKLGIPDILVGEIISNTSKNELLKSGSTILLNRQFKRKDGTLLEMEISARQITGGRMMAFGRDMTERIKNEKAIQKEKELSDLVINSLPGIFYIFDQTPQLIRWNKKFEEISGYSAHELMNIAPISIFHKEDQGLMKQTIEKTYQTGMGEVEARIITKQGKVIPFILTGIAIDYEGKNSILGTGIDITERKATETALAESENFLRTIIQAEPECVKLINKSGELEDMNAAGLQMIEADNLQQVKGHLVANIVCKPYRNDFIALTDNVFKGKPGKLEFEITGLKGTHRWLETHAVPLKNAEGNIISLLGVTRDITGWKKAQVELTRSEEKYKLLFRSNPLPVFMLSLPELTLLDVNDAAIKHYGYSKEEFLQLPVADLVHEEDFPFVLNDAAQLHNNDLHLMGVIRHKIKDGSFIYVEIYSHHIVIEEKLIRLIMAVDITEKLKAEELLKESYEDIRRLASHLGQVREEERTAIAREIHDELGQQLTVMKMDISWLQTKLKVNDEKIREKMNDLLKLIESTIKTVRRISADLRPSILDDFGLLPAMEWHSQEFEKRSGIIVVFSSAMEEISLPDKISTALFRIYQESLTNIIRHANASKVNAHLKIDNGKLVLSIQDNGVGFDPSTIANKKTLGILGMRERTMLLGGGYHIRSIPGKGTITEVHVPLSSVS